MTMQLNHECKGVEDEIATELAKNIREQIDQEIVFNILLATGWLGTEISYQLIDEAKAWVEENKLGEVRWLDNKVAFEQSKDYEWFILRWG